MDTYTLLRQFADSWMLLAMLLAFLGIVLWTLRPGSGAIHRDTAEIPFRNDRLPELRDEEGRAEEGRGGK